MPVSLFPKKITVKTMGLSTRQLEEIAVGRDNGNPLSVVRVWGLVKTAKAGTTSFGTYLTFSGEIAALNLVDGKEARSQMLIVPPQAETIISGMLDKATKDGGAAQVALEITVTENTSEQARQGRGTKFCYGVKPIIEPSGEDALTTMAKALPAPVMAKKVPAKK